MSAWEIVVGLETHAQLATRSKMFSGASTAFGAPPNTQASAVDVALPGVLPVANKRAVECAIRFGLAVGGRDVINRRSIFARKNYFYPDLPKGYQISQYELPVVKGGEIPIVSPTRGPLKIRLTRAHLEEDAGKLLHEDFRGASGVDLNRAGTPLLEIVSEPEMRSAEEAVEYAKALHKLVVEEIGICDGNMQEGSFRFDANVSVRRPGAALGTRCEIKNLNSFRFLQHAIQFEVRRQIEVIEDGGKIVQETRLYDADRDETRSMRTKEEAHDYRYFPDPDLPPLEISEAWIGEIEAGMGESLESRRSRFVAYGLPQDQVNLLVATRDASTFALSTFSGAPREAVPTLSNWILGPLTAKLKEEKLDFSQSKVGSGVLRALLARVADGTISNTTAVGKVLPALWAGEGSVDDIIESKGLKQITDAGEIERTVDEVLAANARQVEDYRAGKEKAFNSLVGQVMKATRGKGNPARISELLRKKLGR
ncbi:MAG TPA: Asp-tRNA(Asn)/Glu-tRNA(Gln) amidotransferase subunit GatB [Burkholderiales bacterium]|nr:Asp-tRNA(Asn)/Glu-tRNA(Gln) amidotransferase subunit GatB [Burkholderiales bacterium]